MLTTRFSKSPFHKVPRALWKLDIYVLSIFAERCHLFSGLLRKWKSSRFKVSHHCGKQPRSFQEKFVLHLSSNSGWRQTPMSHHPQNAQKMYAVKKNQENSQFKALCSQRVFQRAICTKSLDPFEKWTFIFCPFSASDAISFPDFYRKWKSSIVKGSQSMDFNKKGHFWWFSCNYCQGSPYSWK